MSPDKRTECTAGTPATGSGSIRLSRSMRSFPLRSVTSMSPLGSQVRLHGCHRPVAIVVVFTGVALAFCLAFSLPWAWPARSVGSIIAATNTVTESNKSAQRPAVQYIASLHKPRRAPGALCAELWDSSDAQAHLDDFIQVISS